MALFVPLLVDPLTSLIARVCLVLARDVTPDLCSARFMLHCDRDVNLFLDSCKQFSLSAVQQKFSFY